MADLPAWGPSPCTPESYARSPTLPASHAPPSWPIPSSQDMEAGERQRQEVSAAAATQLLAAAEARAAAAEARAAVSAAAAGELLAAAEARAAAAEARAGAAEAAAEAAQARAASSEAACARLDQQLQAAQAEVCGCALGRLCYCHFARVLQGGGCLLACMHVVPGRGRLIAAKLMVLLANVGQSRPSMTNAKPMC